MGLCGEIFGIAREIFTSTEYNGELTLKLEKLFFFNYCMLFPYLRQIKRNNWSLPEP